MFSPSRPWQRPRTITIRIPKLRTYTRNNNKRRKSLSSRWRGAAAASEHVRYVINISLVIAFDDKPRRSSPTRFHGRRVSRFARFLISSVFLSDPAARARARGWHGIRRRSGHVPAPIRFVVVGPSEVSESPCRVHRGHKFLSTAIAPAGLSLPRRRKKKRCDCDHIGKRLHRVLVANARARVRRPDVMRSGDRVTRGRYSPKLVVKITVVHRFVKITVL